jgi:hypothetical protein
VRVYPVTPVTGAGTDFRPHFFQLREVSWCRFGILQSVTYVIGLFASISVFCIKADQAPLRTGSTWGRRARCVKASAREQSQCC